MRRIVNRFMYKFIHSLTRIRLCLVLFFITLSACSSPQWQPDSRIATAPGLFPNYALMSDGYRLPISHYPAEGKPQAVVIALHGFNDYSKAFEGMCQYFSKRGITCYAYDQRGFGATSGRGLWPKHHRLQRDLLAVTQLIKSENPDLPPYLAGESMGGAVVITTLVQYAAQIGSEVDGALLIAPAVWARRTQPWYQRAALWLAVHFAPDWTPTGKGLGIVATDNRAALIAMGKDPLIIKATRIDTIYGLTNLMDEALEVSSRLQVETLILYGQKDEVIPKTPICEMLKKLPQSDARFRLAYYESGYHMLTRDLQSERVFFDELAWISDHRARLPSGEEIQPQKWHLPSCVL